jgi:hypothetical protein
MLSISIYLCVVYIIISLLFLESISSSLLSKLNLNGHGFADLVREANFAFPHTMFTLPGVISLSVGFTLGRLTAVPCRAFGVVEGSLFFIENVLFFTAIFISFFSRSEFKAMSLFDFPLTDLGLFELICNGQK